MDTDVSILILQVDLEDRAPQDNNYCFFLVITKCKLIIPSCVGELETAAYAHSHYEHLIKNLIEKGHNYTPQKLDWYVTH